MVETSHSLVGIVGYGSFGRFMAQHLSHHFEVVVHDQRSELEEEHAERLIADGVRWASLAEVASSPIVVHAVPVQDLPRLLERLRPLLSPGSLFVDVASVKVRPMAMLAEALPAEVEYVGTHPMFGSQSGRDGIAGLEVALCAGRGDSYDSVRDFLAKTLALKVHEMTPEEHDREMAYVQGLTHWMARALREVRTPNLRLQTVAFRHMMKIEENLRDDSWELFRTIESENPFAAEARAELLERLRTIEEKLNE